MTTTNSQSQPSSGIPLPSHPLNSQQIVQDVLPSGRPTRSSIDTAAQADMKKPKQLSSALEANVSRPSPLSSRASAISSTQFEHRHEHCEVRTLPPWIDSLELGEDNVPSGPTDKLLSPPAHLHFAQHHYLPLKPGRRASQDGFVDIDEDSLNGGRVKVPERGLFGPREPDRGRKWDHCREGDPVILQSAVPKNSPWTRFVKSSAYGPAPNEAGERVDETFLDSQAPGLDKPWRGDIEGGGREKAFGLVHSRKKRKIWYQRIQRVILLHPLVPLAFRLTVLATSVIALGLSGSIYYLTSQTNFPQNPSTVMAIVVDVVALPYIAYVTWDEYTGKPLGLRPPKAKMTLVLLDLFFIMFESANLALAFAAQSDKEGVCADGDNGSNKGICGRVITLCTFLFVALVAWSLTFSVSIFRLVERVGSRDEPE